METPSRIAELERKFAENPRRYFAALANEYRKNGEIERAIELCARHLAEQRNHLSGHVVLAQALVDAGRDTDAWEPLHTALDLDPENFIALRLLGELSARAGDGEQARGYFFRALEIEPRNDQILESLKALSQHRAEEPAPDVAEPAAARTEPLPVLPPLPELSVAESAEAAAEPVADSPAETPHLVHDMWGDLRIDGGDEQVAEAASGHEEAAGVSTGFEGHGEAEQPAAVADQTGVVPDESDWAEQPADQEPVAAGEDVWSGWDIPGPQTEGGQAAAPAASGQEARAIAEEHAGYFSVSEEFPVPPSEPQPADEETVSAGAEVEELPPLPRDAEVGAPEAEPATAAAPGGDQEVTPSGREGEERPAESRPTLVSETMVELYLAQGHTIFAIEALRDLVEARPGDERLRSRLAELERSVAPQPRETVRDLFARLGRGRSRTTQAATALAGAFAERKRDDGPVAAMLGGEGAADLADDAALVAVLDDSPDEVPDAAAFGKWLRGLRPS